MTHRNPFLITALRSWNNDSPSYSQQLAVELSRHNKVLYVNPPMDITSLLEGDSEEAEHKNRVIRGSEKALRYISNNLWILEPPIIIPSLLNIYPDGLFDSLNRRNNRRYADVILWAMDLVGINKCVHINDNDLTRSFYMDEFIQPTLSILYRHSDLGALNPSRHHGKRLEVALARKCDMIATTNDTLAEQVRGYNYNTFNIGFGVDVGFFNFRRKYAEPPELKELKHPIFGFVGTLGAATISINIIKKLASKSPKASIVLVGGEDKAFASSELHSMPNIFFVDEKPDKELASYIAHFDVCINPELYNDITNSCTSPHIAHYLAMGKRVVATATDSTFCFAPHALLARDDDQFTDLVAAALAEPFDKERAQTQRTKILEMSWGSCAKKLYATIDLVYNELHDEHNTLTHEKEYLFS